MDFKFNVTIEANSNDEAKTKLQASINLMKAACSQMSVNEYVGMVKKIVEKPSKIKLAKNFI